MSTDFERQAACAEVRGSFSAYLDGAVSGREMNSIALHLDRCPPCQEEFAGLRGLQQTLAGLGAARPPADLGLKLRLAISRENQARRSSWRDSFIVRWENAFRPMLVQISSGLAGAVLLIGTVLLLSSTVAPQTPVMASDEPGIITPPHYLYSASSPRPILTGSDTTIVVEALVNDQGLVYDYTVVSGPQNEAVRKQIEEELMLSVFEPAKVFRMPVRGRVVMAFAGISVHG